MPDRLLAATHSLGQYVLLLVQAGRSLGEVRSFRMNGITQMVRIGVESIPIVLMASGFSGMVLTLQSGYHLSTFFAPPLFIGAIVGPSVILELGALSTGFVLASRVGARIAAELGAMRVSEQIDALEAMGLNSVGYLIVPRVLAGMLMVPMLYVLACVVGIGGSIAVGEISGYVTMPEFMQGARQFHEAFDPYFGLIKSVTFGFIITSISCYQGYYTSGGAEGVGRSTTEAVVQSCVFILVADLVLALLFL